MNREQLVAFDQRVQAQLQQARETVLRLEGYRMAIADIIKADTEAATTETPNEPAA